MKTVPGESSSWQSGMHVRNRRSRGATISTGGFIENWFLAQRGLSTAACAIYDSKARPAVIDERAQTKIQTLHERASVVRFFSRLDPTSARLLYDLRVMYIASMLLLKISPIKEARGRTRQQLSTAGEYFPARIKGPSNFLQGSAIRSLVKGRKSRFFSPLQHECHYYLLRR